MLQLSQPDQVGKLFGAQVLVPWFNHARDIFRTPEKEKRTADISEPTPNRTSGKIGRTW